MSNKNTNTIQELMEKYSNVSLHSISKEFNLTYQLVLKEARKPIEGVPYNPNDTNYCALRAYFEKKGVLTDILDADWEKLNSVHKGHVSALCKDMEQFHVGSKVFLREDNDVPFEIVYKTDTHVVIMLEGTTEPRSMSHSTFLLKGPSFTKRVITNR